MGRTSSPILVRMLLVASGALWSGQNSWSNSTRISTRNVHFQSVISVYIDVIIIIRKIFTFFLYILSMKTSGTSSNFLVHFQEKFKNFVANLIISCAVLLL